jgi:hypothetical protein
VNLKVRPTVTMTVTTRQAPAPGVTNAGSAGARSAPGWRVRGPPRRAGRGPRPGPPGAGAVAPSKPGRPARPVPGEDSS